MTLNRRRDLLRRAERHSRAVIEARSVRRVATSIKQVEHLDVLVRRVAATDPRALAAVEASYVSALAALSERSVQRGWVPNRPRELFSAWIAEALGVRSLFELRSFLDAFWSGPRLPYEEVLAELPRVQRLRRLHDLASRTSIWQQDPSWPDPTARAALEIAAVGWAELSGASHPASSGGLTELGPG